jgi:C4-dicarboxylate transporter DctM subunit
MILFIISTAIVFGNWLTEAGLPAQLVKVATDMKLSAFGFLLACNLILLFLGCFLEVVSTMLITLPIMLPLVSALGIDLVHFGIMMTLNMEIALITPPVGLNLYVVSGVGNRKGCSPLYCHHHDSACHDNLLACLHPLCAEPAHAQINSKTLFH